MIGASDSHRSAHGVLTEPDADGERVAGEGQPGRFDGAPSEGSSSDAATRSAPKQRPRRPKRANKPYVGDYGAPAPHGAPAGAARFGMVALALAVGFVIGFLVWGVFTLSSILISLIWDDLGGTVAHVPFVGSAFPVIVCTVGGLIIGLWSTYVGGSPRALEEVMADVKRTGGYRTDGIGRSIVGFLLPLAFGGSIGPEAGLTGIIAAACTWIGRTLKAAGLKVRGIADLTVSAALSAVFATPLVGIVSTAQDAMPKDDAAETPTPDGYDFRRWAKIVLYAAAAFGACGGIACLGALVGEGGGLPRFDGIALSGGELLWLLPCLALGYALALSFHAGTAGFSKLSAAIGTHPVLKPVIAGLALGCTALALPDVLFSGEAQSIEIMGEWQAAGAAALFGTAFAKMLATPLCLHFGWRGGIFFPSIFAGISGGYAIATVAGVDPMFCVAVVAATSTAGIMRKPLAALALLILCFPVSSVVWMGIACLIGASLPVPTALLPRQMPRAKRPPRPSRSSS